MRPRPRALPALTAALGAVLAVGVNAALAAVLWTMTMSPLTATVGTSTRFDFTATSLDVLLGIKCFVVDVPAAIEPGEVWVAASSTTAAWTVSRSGQRITVVIASGDGNQKLRAGDWISFAMVGVPRSAGAYAVPGTAFSDHECASDPRPLAVPPLVVIAQPVVIELIPTPAPTPTPAPVLGVPSLPPVLPSAGLPLLTPAPRTPAPTPAQSAPRPSTTVTPTPAPTSAPTATPPGEASSGPGSAPGDGGAAPTAGPSGPLTIVTGPDAQAGVGSVSLGPLGVVEGLTLSAIPGAFVGGPGLAVIVWVAIQTGVAAAWVPAVRRMSGDGTARRRGLPRRRLA